MPRTCSLRVAAPLVLCCWLAQLGGADWVEIWRDDFDGPTVDSSTWSAVKGNGSSYGAAGFGNNEMEFYTSRPSNLRVRRGRLVIEAHKETAGKHAGRLTSARIHTLNKAAFAPNGTYPTIKVEASIKLPRGRGLWPAFWMLPEHSTEQCLLGCGAYGNWPLSGELDILESKDDMLSAQGTIHWGVPDHRMSLGIGPYDPSWSKSLSDGFHTFGVGWSDGEIRWYLDGKQYHSALRKSQEEQCGYTCPAEGAEAGSPFDRPFYITLNLALGGMFTCNDWSHCPPCNGCECSPCEGKQCASREEVEATLEANSQSGAKSKMVVDWVAVSGLPAA